MPVYKDELYHHGIKGQKWGVRRYRNTDGTLTEAGKQRYGDSNSKGSSGIGKKIAVGAAIGVGVGLTAYALANPTSRKALAKFAKTGASAVAAAGKKVGKRTGSIVAEGWEKAKPKIKEAASNRAKGLGTALDKATESAFSASMVVLGGVVVSKVSQRFDTTGDENDPKTIRNKMIVESTKAATNTFTSNAFSSTQSKGQKKGGGSVGKEVSDRLGPPTHKPIDKQSSEWAALFKDSSGNNRPDDVRATIKTLSKDYDIDQIKKYLDMVDRKIITHSDIPHVNRYLRHQCYELELYHHGIKGQKWGVRRYQNADGSLTTAGLHRYYGANAHHRGEGTSSGKSDARSSREASSTSSAKRKGLTDGQKKALKIGAAVAVAGLAAYGAYKLHETSVKKDVMDHVNVAYNMLADTELDTMALKTGNLDFNTDAMRTKIHADNALAKKNAVDSIYKQEAAFRRRNAIAKVSDKVLGTSKAKSIASSPLHEWDHRSVNALTSADRARDQAIEEYKRKYGNRALIEALSRVDRG